MIGLACGYMGFNPVSSFFFRALEKEFGWSKTASAISLIALPVMGLLMPFIGMLLDRFGVRLVVLVSAIIYAGCFYLLSMMNGELGMFYAGFLALSFFGIATSAISYTRVIATRFRASRGTALAVALGGTALAGAVLPQLLASVFASGGWRAGYHFMAGWALVGGIIAVLMIRPANEGAQVKGSHTGDTLREAARKRSFWILGAGVFLSTGASLGFVSQLQSLVLEKGFDAGTAPLILSILAISVFGFRLVIGWGMDVRSPERIAALAFALTGIGMLVWLYGGPTATTAVIGTLLLGLSIGAELDIMSFFCARLFGLRHFSTVYGAFGMLAYLGLAVGAISYGQIHDRTGSYASALLGATIVSWVVAVLFLVLRPEMLSAKKARDIEGEAPPSLASKPAMPLRPAR